MRDGTRIDALRFALGANAAHGLKRSNADKANAVKIAYQNRLALGLGEVPAARTVGDLVGVRHETAAVHLANFASWRNAQARTGADGITRSLPPPPTRRPAPQAPAPEPETAAGREPEYASSTPPPTRPPPVRQAPGPGPEEDAGPGPETSAPTPPPTRQGPPQRRTVPADDPAMTDGRGREIPPELAEIWNRRKEISDLARLVGQARTALKAAQAGNDPLWAEINHSSVQAYLDRSYAEIAAAMPWCVCPMCQGIGCSL